MPELPISDGSGNLIDQRGEIIIPYMFHPVDSEKRQVFAQRIECARVLRLLKDAPDDEEYKMTAAQLRVLLDLAVHPQSDIFKSNFMLEIGDILFINLACAKHRPKLQGVKRAIHALHFDGLSKRSLLDLWVDYKSVAHFWAALLHWSGRPVFYAGSKKERIDELWITDPIAKLQFLAMAEAIRAMAENTYAHGQERRFTPNPLLTPTQSYTVPADLHLPPVTIDLPPLPEALVQELKKYRP